VTLFEADADVGGQFNIAKQIPGKEEFYETLRYFRHEIKDAGVKTRFNTRVTADELIQEGFDEVILATGVTPRTPSIDGIDHPKVLSYLDVLRDKKPVGKAVAVIGAGGIGFDVAEYLTHEGESPSLNLDKFNEEWGIDSTYADRGGIKQPHLPKPPRQIFLLQRKTSKVGDGLGKTTGWIHRTSLKNRNVEMIAGASYSKVDDAGLHINVGGKDIVLPVDNVVLCAGQEPFRALQADLEAAGRKVTLIGGGDGGPGWPPSWTPSAPSSKARKWPQRCDLAHLQRSLIMTISPTLKPQAAASLALWHEMVAQQDLGRLPSILHGDAVFRSPMAFKPYASAAAVNLILTTVVQVFQGFTYHRTLVSDDGLNVVLEFNASVGDKQLKGIDMIRFDEEGKIVDFEVMIRPMSGLQALGAEMGARLAAYLPAYKA